MGCDTYYSNNTTIRFDEMNDDVSCLCTFPHNDNEVLYKNRLRSLAMLGAAVVLNHQERGAVQYLPDGLPKWILDGIDKYLPEEE